jgi:hypothetical protein
MYVSKVRKFYFIPLFILLLSKVKTHELSKIFLIKINKLKENCFPSKIKSTPHVTKDQSEVSRNKIYGLNIQTQCFKIEKK